MIKRITLLLLVLFLTVSPCYAQVAAKNKVVVLDDFSGGLVSQLSPYSLSSKQADICENARLDEELKSLSKRQQVLLFGTADATEAITGAHRLYLKDGTKVLLVTHGDEIEKGDDTTGNFTNILNLSAGNYRWQFTTWNNIGIGSDGYNQPIKFDGTSGSATYLGTALATATSTGAGPSGNYTYKTSFYTASYEVAFNVTSNPVYVSNKDVSLSMIPIGPDTYGGETVIGRYVYRNESSGATFKRLSNGNITDNVNVTLTDSDADGELNATTYNVTYTCTPPKFKIPLIHYNRLFGANNPTTPSRLYYSDDSNPDYFLPTDYYRDIRPDDGDQITFAKTFLGVLTIGKENSIQKVYTDGATPTSDWTTSDVFSTIGCKAMYSAQDTPVGIIYLGSDGLYKFNGQYSVLVSEAVTPEIKDILGSNRANVWAQYHKSVYYLAYASKKTGVAENNRILLYNLVNNNFVIDTLSANCFTTFGSGTDWDTLYYGSSVDGKVYQYTFQAYEIYHHKHSDFSGDFTNARYIPDNDIVGGDADHPVLQISRAETINNMVGLINSQTGTIDRATLTGNYVSPAMNLGAQAFDKAYWKERFYSGGDDITIALRSSTSEPGLTTSGSWGGEFTDPSGSDISGETANGWIQYRISLTTDAYTHSPELYDYIRITYLKEAALAETAIPLHWRSGYLDFLPGYKKTLRKIQVYYSGNAGILNLKFETQKGDSDTFAINMADHPDFYEGYITGGGLTDELFRLDITNNDLNPLIIRKIVILADIEPII